MSADQIMEAGQDQSRDAFKKDAADPFANVRRIRPDQTVMDNQRLAQALLMAVEEGIRESRQSSGKIPHSDPISPTAYFAALISLLSERELTDTTNDEVAAMMYLLSMLLPSISATVLQETAEDVQPLLLELLQSYSDHAALVRHAMDCVKYVLLAQSVSQWSSGLINQLFQTLLPFLSDPRNKVRMACQHCVLDILRRPPAPLSHHPASMSFTRSLLASLKQELKSPAGKAPRRAKTEDDPFVLLLIWIKTCWKQIAGSSRMTFVQLLLTTFASPDKHITQERRIHALDALSALLDMLASSDESTISVKDQCLLLDRLMQSQPKVDQVSVLTVWLHCVVSSIKSIHVSSPSAAKSLVSDSIYPRCFSLLQFTPHSQANVELVHQCIEDSLAIMLRTVVDVNMIEESLRACKIPLASRTLQTQLESIISKTGMGLSLMYQSGWPSVLFLIATLLNLLRRYHVEASFTLMRPILEVLSDDDIYACNERYPHRDRLEMVFAAAIRSCGPDHFLEVFPLNLEKDHHQRTWILPIMKLSIRNARLGLFIHDFVPLAHRIAIMGHSLIADNRPMEGKSCSILWRQLWDLLPAFCDCPFDIQQQLVPLLDLVLPVIASDADHGVIACSGLRELVLKLTELANMSTEAAADFLYTLEPEQAQQALFGFKDASSRVFPVLFAKYMDLSNGTVSENVQAYKSILLETIRIWLTVSDTATVNRFISTMVRRYVQTASSEKDPKSMVALLDLMHIFLASKFLASEFMEVLLQLFVRGIEHEDGTVQKRSYRGLCLTYQSIGASESAAQLSQGNSEKLLSIAQQVLNDGLIPAGSTKRDRLTFLLIIVDSIIWTGPDDVELKKLLGMFPVILTEAVLGTKEVNEKSRSTAYELLVRIGRKATEIEAVSSGSAVMQTDGQMEAIPLSLDEIFKMVMAGLAGKTPYMISASIYCLSRLIYEFQREKGDVLKDTVIGSIARTVFTFVLESKNHEIIKAAISFVKVLLSCCVDLFRAVGDVDDFSYLRETVLACVRWSSQHKSHFRVPCRRILDKLVRKFGFDSVATMFPAEESKLFANIRKRHERSVKRKREDRFKSFDEVANVDSDEDDESEPDDEDLPSMLKELAMAAPKGKRARSMSGMKAVLDDDVMDLIDHKASISLLQGHGIKKRKRSDESKSDYRMSSDGRVVIQLDEEDKLDGDTEDLEMDQQLEAANEAYMESRMSLDSFKVCSDGKKIKFNNQTSDPFCEEQTKRGKMKSKPLNRQQRTEKALKRAGVRHSGKEFRGKRGKGDIKKPGGPDPYAYIPLNAKVVAKNSGRRKGVKIDRDLFGV